MATGTALDDPESYTVGWIAALPIERAAAIAMLDEKHAEPKGFTRHPTDTNVYTWGRMGEHNIAIASLAAGVYGLTSAATTASSLSSSLPSIRIGLLVGIGGGIPRPDEGRDIRLGDVAVSKPDGTTGGVCQYDLVKARPGKRRERKGFLGKPPTVLLKALTSIRADHEMKDSKIPELVEGMLKNNPKMAKKSKQSPGYVHQGFDSDRLFDASYEHVSGPDCHSCGEANEVEREPRDTTNPEIHYGVIASGNTLVKDAAAREQIVADVGEDCICFEMEAAGLMNHFPCLVIRGISDYADSHKNDRWQRYASATAAAYAKEFLAYVPAAEVQGSKRALEILESVEQKVTVTQQTTLAMKEAVESVVSGNQREKIRHWLAPPPDPSTNANQARKLRHEGTGGWLLETAEFQNWVAGTYRHLWLHGLAGCGKTVLSSTILDHLMGEDGRVVLSFFFDFSDQTKQTLDGMLRSLASQLYQGGLDSAARLDNAFRAHRDGENKPTTNFLRDAVRMILADQKQVFVVIDALDESTTRDEICSWIKSMFSTPELVHVRLLYTGRPEAEFISEIPTLIGEESCLRLNKLAIDADIRSYVTARLENDPGFNKKRLSEDLIEQLRDRVGNRADGMFRWAVCQLDALSRCLTPMALKKDLDRLPRDLTETYDRVFHSIPEGYRSSSMRLLQFVVHSKKPLTLEVAVEVVATNIEDDPPHFHPDGRVFTNADILRHCPSLVSVIEIEDSEGVRKELHLAHFSVKEYLLHQHNFDIMNSSITITRTCLAYLTDIDCPRWRLAQEFPMAQYAAESWLDFAKAGCTEQSTDVKTTISFSLQETSSSLHEIASFLQEIASFLQKTKYLKRWTYLNQEIDGPLYDSPGRLIQCGLYYACRCGLTAVAKLFIDEGADVNSHGGAYGTALQAASHFGHLETVRLLVDNQAETNAEGGEHGTALQAASSEGHLEIVRLLLDKKANVNAEAGAFETALQAASYNRHLKIVRLLLDEQADVNAKGGKHGTALQAALHDKPMDYFRVIRQNPNGWDDNGLEAAKTAAYDRCFEIIRTLLDKQADVNASREGSGTPLEMASHHGDLKIVKMILEYGANVNIPGKYYGGPLKAASNTGHEDIALLLLDRGADFSSQDDIRGNLLNAASHGGSEKIVQMLIDKNVDVNIQVGMCDTALYAASLMGRERIVQMLIDEGADVNSKGRWLGSALQAASYHGHEGIVQMLLNNGADVNAQAGEYGNALQAASYKGDEKIVEMLINSGAHVNSQGGKYGTALRGACCGGRGQIVKMLLQSGADFSTLISDYSHFLGEDNRGGFGTFWQVLTDMGADLNVERGVLTGFLQHASNSVPGCIELMEKLVSLGADVNPHAGGILGNPLLAASIAGNQEAVQRLVRLGADINQKSEEYFTALDCASAGDDESFVEMLLDLGADINAKDTQSTTALVVASYHGCTDIVRLLLDHGADFTIKHMTGMTPLHAASLQGHLKVVELLWERGADVTATGPSGMTPLHAASFQGHLKVVELLCEKGADVTATDMGGTTPLHAASLQGHFKVVELLCEKGADIAATDMTGKTPLRQASFFWRLDVVKLLCEKGADVTFANTQGSTPLHAATIGNQDEVVKLIVQEEFERVREMNTKVVVEEISCMFQPTPPNGPLKVVEILLEREADVTAVDMNGLTPLHLASINGYSEVVSLFLSTHHIGLDLKDTAYGRTALSYAAEKGHQEVVELLLTNAHISARSKDHLDRTPLYHASNEGQHTIVDSLLRQDPSVANLPDRYGSTCLSAAARKGHLDVVNSLLDASVVGMVPDCLGRTPLWWARRYGHTAISQLLLENAKERGVTLSHEVAPEVITRLHTPVARVCDACTFSVSAGGDYYRCSDCNGGNFDICGECFTSGIRCLQPSHELVFMGSSGDDEDNAGDTDDDVDENEENGGNDEDYEDDEDGGRAGEVEEIVLTFE